MNEDVRKGVTEAKVNETAFGIIAVDALVIATAAGVVYESWAYGIGTFAAVAIVLGLISQNEKLAMLVAVVAGILWGYVGYRLAIAFDATNGGAMIIGGVVGLVSLGMHLQGLTHLKDIAGAQTKKP
jgi:hypothetical protein